jgi:hypothetical protein
VGRGREKEREGEGEREGEAEWERGRERVRERNESEGGKREAVNGYHRLTYLWKRWLQLADYKSTPSSLQSTATLTVTARFCRGFTYFH